MSRALASLEGAALASARRVAADLVHDVAKYVSRIARNVAPGADVPAALAPMLVRDCYETHGGKPASLRYAALAAELPLDDARLDEARAHLRAIDALEARARAHEPAALRELAAHARAVDESLRGLARDVASATKERG